MANTFVLKRSSVAGKAPTTEQLAVGEIAVNLNDGKLYTKEANNKILTLSESPHEFIVASEALSAGDWVNVYSNNGVANVRKASAADANTPMTGFVLQAYTVGQSAKVYFSGTNDAVSGVTIGTVYLSNTPGLSTDNPPAANVQIVGTAVSSTRVRMLDAGPIRISSGGGGGAGLTFTESEQPPASSVVGDVWLQTSTGVTYTRVSGLSGSVHWVEFASVSTPSSVSTNTTLTVVDTVGRANLTNHLLSSNAHSQYALKSEVIPGVKWTSRVSAADNQWYSVCYGNGLFVAVSNSGTGNRIMTSPDGVNWTTRVSSADSSWRSVCYGNGLFVAVSATATNNVMTSTDGVNWISRVSGNTNSWFAVCYGNGLFVAVSISGTGNRVMTSVDGITWILRTTPVDNDWRTVCYGNGLFVAISDTAATNKIMTSSDGITWTIRQSPKDANNWYDVCYGNGLFVAVSYSGTGDRVMTSPDGINWTLRTSAVDNSWQSVCYGGGFFVAVSADGTGNRVMVSPDGINWTPRTTPADLFWISVCYGNGLFVAVSYTGTGNRVMTSGVAELTYVDHADRSGSTVMSTHVAATDPHPIYPLKSQTQLQPGITWTSRVSAADNQWNSVCYGNGLFVAVSSTGTGNCVMTSPDGVNWTTRVNSADNQWRSVCYGNGLFVAISDNGVLNRVMVSADGINWTSRVSVGNNSWSSVCYGNGLFVVVSRSTVNNQIMTSPDGTTWTLRTSAANNPWQSVCYGNGLFVAVSITGTGNSVMTSPDGINWTSRFALNTTWQSVCYGNGLFVAVSSSLNFVMTSPDGINWTTYSGSSNIQWYSICYGNGLFVAVGSSGTGNRVMTSPDGINWTSRVSAADNGWNSVCYGNGLFVAVSGSGTGNRVMTSGVAELTYVDHVDRARNTAVNIIAFEALAASDLINVFSSSGTAYVRKANASVNGCEAHGYVKAAVASGSPAAVFFEGNVSDTGLTPGALYLSATTAGKTTSTPPTTPGSYVQKVGIAFSSTEYAFIHSNSVAVI